MGTTDSKTLSEGPAGQHTQALNNSPSCTVQDSFHLFELHGHDQVHRSHSRRGPHRPGVDWTAIHETKEWGCTFGSDSNGEWQDGHLFSSIDNPSTSSVGRSASPGPPPYATTKAI